MNWYRIGEVIIGTAAAGIIIWVLIEVGKSVRHRIRIRRSKRPKWPSLKNLPKQIRKEIRKERALEERNKSKK